MFEVYSFAVMFAAQILILSILHPARLTRHIRAEIARYSAGSFSQVCAHHSDNIARRLASYRRLNTIIALLGLILLGALFYYMLQPGWDDGPVETVVSLYFMLQVFPFFLASWFRQFLCNCSLRTPLSTEFLKRETADRSRSLRK